MLLFFLLATDVLVNYRLRGHRAVAADVARPAPAAARAEAAE